MAAYNFPNASQSTTNTHNNALHASGLNSAMFKTQFNEASSSSSKF